MVNWIVTFFVLAIIASILGFGGLAGTFSQITQFLAVIFLVLFVASLIFSLISGKRVNPPL